VAHPGLEPIARAEFDAVLTGPNQLDRMRDDVEVDAEDLLRPISGDITEHGLRSNIRIALLYLEAWLGGNGCVPIDNLMEDAATAEISRAQLWQWIRNPEAKLESGANIDSAMYRAARSQILEMLMEHADQGMSRRLKTAKELLDKMVLEDEFPDFLTLDAYRIIS
jgi:malate synthase